MKKEYRIISLFILSVSHFMTSQSYADQLCLNKNSYFIDDETIQNVKDKDSSLAFCRKMGRIDSQKELNSVLNKYFDDLEKYNDHDRQKANQKLNDCLPNSNSKALVIAFEGTGAYEPIIPVALTRLNQCFAGKIDNSLTQKLNYTAHKIYKSRYGKNPNWSGLESGAMEELAGRSDAANIDWFSFPSEELEQIGGKAILEKDIFFQITNDVKNSVQMKPKGIQNALACIEKYQKAAAQLHIKPKIILMSHSSGGTALVKFSEHLKKQSSVEIDLAFSIDPVKEAHEAFKEVVGSKVSSTINPFERNKNSPLVVSSHVQKDKLYKPTNIKKFCNFYQRSDTTGLNMGFGIQGSPVYQAENSEIKNLSKKGHGEITYDPSVLKSFHHQLDYLLYRKGKADCD
jgi:hypothetical protein